MATFSFIVVPSVPPPPSSSSDPILTPIAGTSVCLPKVKTKQDFLDLFDRIVPFEYIEPLKSPGPGYEILEMFAKVGERISLAVGRTECQFYSTLAHGAYKSRGQVEFYRTSSANGAFTLLTGSVVRTSKTSREFVLLEDVVFGATDLFQLGMVEARQGDFQFDVKGITLDANGNELEGEIDELILPLMSPSYGEPNLLVRQTYDVDRGQPGSLDQLGADRSVPRATLESDDEYRVRVRNLPDTISPAAMLRQLNAFFLPTGIPFDFLEVFENRMQSCWNAPAGGIVNEQVGDYNPNLFVYNDPRDIIGNRWLGANTVGGGIVVRIPNITINDHGFPFDAADVSEVTGIPAFDVTLADAGVYDGEDLESAAFLLLLFNLMRKIKAAGVATILELEGQ